MRWLFVIAVIIVAIPALVLGGIVVLGLLAWLFGGAASVWTT